LSDIPGVKNYRILLSAILALSFALAVSARADSSWQTDYKNAQEQAKTAHKLLLVDFTGSDWCGWCKRLTAEVFSKPEFQDYATKNLVLLEVDFPRRKAQSDEIKKQNEKLAEEYQIQGFPTIIVLNAEGKKVGELGYMPGGASAFIAQLEKLRKG
jgi:thioredoxin-related protein